jgi:multiple sugar transport system substrate-binding protein
LELKYSYIGAQVPVIEQLLNEFSSENHLHIERVQLGWGDAWQEILGWSLHGLHGQGPDISHIGSTWSPSLVGMESLRPFSLEEVRPVGGEKAFLPHCWQSGLSAENDRVWSLPWHGYTFLISYRRDLLEKAGIDEKTAFQSAESLSETVTKLKGKISAPPWVVPVSQTHLATMHCLAPWVWGAGGDFFTEDNKQAAFLEPAALDAICSYYSLLPFMSPIAAIPQDEPEALKIFLDGQAAIGIVSAAIAYNWMLLDQHDQGMSPEMREKVGFASIPGTPWVGGDNIIVWKQASLSMERERAVLALARNLVSCETQRAFAQSHFTILPTRVDAFDALPMQGSSLTDAVLYSLRQGRSYRPMKIWAKIEHQFGQVFGNIGAEILAGADVGTTVHKHLEAHAKRLGIALQS